MKANFTLIFLDHALALPIAVDYLMSFMSVNDSGHQLHFFTPGGTRDDVCEGSLKWWVEI